MSTDRLPEHYEIRVVGHLAARWTAWFDGLELAAEGDGTTVIRGAVADQAALHGLLAKLRDLGLPLVAVTPLWSAPADRGTGPSEHHTPGATS